jgi:hypothetical protein
VQDIAQENCKASFAHGYWHSHHRRGVRALRKQVSQDNCMILHDSRMRKSRVARCSQRMFGVNGFSISWSEFRGRWVARDAGNRVHVLPASVQTREQALLRAFRAEQASTTTTRNA